MSKSDSHRGETPKADERAHPSVDQFVQSLTDCGLMTHEEVEAFLSGLPEASQPRDGKQLAEALFRENKLTRFQAQAVYQGKTRGLVVGNYIVLDRLGKGGIGHVYRARHRVMERVVALKVLSSQATRSEKVVKRFHREAKAAARLAHSNIVTAYDADEAQGVHFLVMEYADGQDLATLVKKRGPLSVRRAVDCILQAARGLEYAHSHGVVHRDIKPQNLLIDRQGTVKIRGMGLARMEQDMEGADAGLTQSGQVMGTLDFMAPEQTLDANAADARSDIYSLGCTLHYLLTDQPPYPAGTSAKGILAQGTDPIPSLRATRRDVPELLDQMFQKMLAKQPKDRQQTVTELITELNGCLADASLAEATESAPDPCDAMMSLAPTPELASEDETHQAGQFILPSAGPAIAPVSKHRSWPKQYRVLLVGLAAASIVGVVLAAMFLLLRPQGTVTVAVSEPGATVQLLDAEGRVQREQTTDGKELAFALRPGKWQIRVEKDGFEVFAKDVTLEDDDETLISATLAPLALVPRTLPLADATPHAEAPGLEAQGMSEAVEPEVTQVADKPSRAADSDDAETAASSASVEPAPDERPSEPLQPRSLADLVAPEKEPPAQSTVSRHPVPDKSAQEQAIAAVKERFAAAYGNPKPHVQLALAAKLIDESRKTQDVPERYVLLDEACKLAVSEGDLVLGTIAADELAQHFQRDSLTLREELVRLSLRQAKTPAALALPIDAAFTLARDQLTAESFDEVQSILRGAAATAARVGGRNLGKTVLARAKLVQGVRQMYDDSRSAAAVLAKDASNADANLTLGRFYCVAAEDWEAGLPLLAQGSDKELKGPAARLVADSSDTGAQLALADAWWKMAAASSSKTEEAALLRNAACHWYGEAASRLAGDEQARAQMRLLSAGSPPSSNKQRPYQVSMTGLSGLADLVPEKVTGKVAPGGGFANFFGEGRIDYPEVRAVSYIHEFEVTFAKPTGSLTLSYGRNRTVKPIVEWERGQSKFFFDSSDYGGGSRAYGGGVKPYRVGEKLRFTLFVNQDSRLVRQNNVDIGFHSLWPNDLQLSIYTSPDTVVSVSQCVFRPWTQIDAQQRRCELCPSRIDGDLVETAIQWHERNLDLDDRPNTGDAKPFVVGTSATPMQWAPAGVFERTYANVNPPLSPTKVTITRGFWIGRYEVTQAEWARLMPLATSHVTGSPFLPVDGVRWEDAARFCMLLTEREKKAHRLPEDYLYRLPTEAEWEYACRAGSQLDFCTGEYDFWSRERSDWQPHEVGTSTPNQWGLFDMHGNVAEWCCEMWQDLPAKSPFQLVDPFRPPVDNKSLLCWRGGNWWQPERDTSCSARARARSEDTGHTGFRIVLGPILRPK